MTLSITIHRDLKLTFGDLETTFADLKMTFDLEPTSATRHRPTLGLAFVNLNVDISRP